jgi:purine-binding chemotaxis protein CheW
LTNGTDIAGTQKRSDDSQLAELDTVDIVPFELDGHRFALLAVDVQEVLRAATPSPLPKAPLIILGVLNVRGTLVPVLDLRSRFRLTPRALRHTDHLLVVRPRDARTSAIVVDRAASLRTLPVASIQDAMLRAGESEHVGGIATVEDGSIVIYDLAKFLTTDEALSLDEALGNVQNVQREANAT